MKRTLRQKTLFTTASLAAAFTLAPFARAQSNPQESKGVERPMVQQHVAEQNASGAATAISIASDEAKHVKDHTAKKLAGHKVRGSDGKDLGSVKDFLVDAHAGSVNYAIVSSGGVAGMGDKLRLVPFSALKESTEKKDSFALNCDKATFEQIPVVKEDEFKDGRYTVSSSQREQLAKLDANASATVSVDVNSYLVRASDIAGKELHSGATDIGKIEAVVIDTDACTATALFDPKNDFTSKKQKYLVPLPKLQLAGARHEPITTSLTRAEFEQAGTSSSVSSTTTTANAPSVAASTTSAPPPVSAPATASTKSDMKSDQKTTTAANESTANTDTVASATRSVSRAAIPPEDKTAQRMSEAQKTGVASTDASQDIAVATGEKKTESSASGEQKELSPTGRTSSDSDKSVAVNAESSTKKSDESSKAATAETAGAEASKSVAQTSDQSKKDETKEPSSTARPSSDSDKSVAADTESSAKAKDSSKATTTDVVGADASKGLAQASDSSNKDQAKATTGTRDDQQANSQASSSAVAANDSATTAGASVNNADAQKKSTDVGSTDQSSTKAAGNIAANSATSRSATTNDPELSPTGKSGAEQTPSANSDLVATAQSIRKALDDDATLAHLDVQVTPENDTIVLRGNVTDQRLANAIEKRAHEKGGGTKIDNQIRVQRK